MEPESHLENTHHSPLQSSLKIKGKITEIAAELFQTFTFTAEHKSSNAVSLPIHEDLGSLIGVEIKYKDELFSCQLSDNNEALKMLGDYTFFNEFSPILDRSDTTKPLLLFSFGELFPTQAVTITLKYVQELIFNDNHIHLFIPKESLQYGNSLSLMLEFSLENINSLHSTSPKLHNINNNSSLHYEGETLDTDILISVTLSSTAVIYSPIAEKDNSLSKIAGRGTYVPGRKCDRPYHFEILVDALESASTNTLKKILEQFLRGLTQSVPHTFNLSIFGESTIHHSESPSNINDETISSAMKFLEENLQRGQTSDLKGALEKIYATERDNLRIVLISDGGFQDVSGVLRLVREKSSLTPVFPITTLKSEAFASIIAVARESGGRVEFILGYDDNDLQEKSRRQAVRAEQELPPHEPLKSDQVQIYPGHGPFNTLWRGEVYAFYFLADESLEGSVNVSTSQGGIEIKLPEDLKFREQSLLSLLANKQQVLTEKSSFISIRGHEHALICSRVSSIKDYLKEINYEHLKESTSDLKVNGISSSNGDCGTSEDEEEQDVEDDEDEGDDEEDEEDEQKVVLETPKHTSKLVYEPEFLLKFQNSCTEKPAGLDSTLEIILGNQIPKKSNRTNKNSGGGGGGDRNYKERGGNHGRRDRNNKRNSNNHSGNHSPTTNLPPVQLAQSENAWKRPSANQEEIDEVQLVIRKLQGILNKLTLENFGSLLKQIIDEVKSAEILEETISLVFDKALAEPNFSKMYVDLCIALSKILPSSQEMGDFRRLLLSKCQEEFEKTSQQREQVAELIRNSPNMSPEERDEKVDKVKRRALGNVKFIGELFKGQMLSSKVMHECIIRLLGQDQKPNYDDLEALCKLLTTIGQDLERRVQVKSMDDLFQILQRLSDSKELPNRFRFMLKDLIDLRKSDWVPRIKQEEQKLIKDIHKDAKQQELKKENQRREPDRDRERDRDGRSSLSQSTSSMMNSSNQIRKSFDVSSSSASNSPAPRESQQQRQSGGGPSQNTKTPLSARASPSSAPPQSPHTLNSSKDDTWETAGTSKNRGQSKSGQQQPSSPATWSSKVGNQNSGKGGYGGSSGGGKKQNQPHNQSQAWKSSSEGAALKLDQSPRSGRFNPREAPSGGTRNVFNLLDNNDKPSPSRDSNKSGKFEANKGGRRNQVAGESNSNANRQQNQSNRQMVTNHPLSISAPVSAADLPPNSTAPRKETTPPDTPLNLSSDSIDRNTEADQKEIEIVLKEFLHILEDEEAVSGLQAIPSSSRDLIIQELLNSALDCKEKQRDSLQSLFVTLLQEKVLTQDDTIKGFNAILSTIEDIELDNPLVINYFGQFVGRAVAHGFVSLSFLDPSSPVLEELIPVGKASKLLLEILDTVNKIKGIDGVKTAVNEGNQDFGKFLKPGQTIESLVQANPAKEYLQALQK